MTSRLGLDGFAIRAPAPVGSLDPDREKSRSQNVDRNLRSTIISDVYRQTVILQKKYRQKG
jgi:hypothetical protein